MPTLLVKPSQGSAFDFMLRKPLTVIGNGPTCDLVLADDGVQPLHAHIRCDGAQFQISPLAADAEVVVNEKRRKKHVLNHQDRIQIGGAEICFSFYDEPQDSTAAAPKLQSSELYCVLHELATDLLMDYDIDPTLIRLMDGAVAISGADKGFLVLFEEGDPVVRVARNVGRETVADAIDQLSDSLVAKVVETQEPLIVSDALRDDAFSEAKSILNLKVVSVMCVPLKDRDRLIGLIYVGNDRVTHLFDQEKLEALTILAAQASLIVKNALRMNALTLDRADLAERLNAMRFGRIVGASPPMRDVFRKADRVATTDVSVLISGETGTGKELVAVEIHERSLRAKGPFVSINCGAIPEQLLESELFGHARGAFTGAISHRRGKFQVASGGTLFLDEIGELPVALQVKLLRALQDKAVTRVGDNHPEAVDIRVLAATNKDLQAAIAAGEFREDLFYRLHVVHIELPPLRERGDDVVVIAKYLLQAHAQDLGGRVKGFTPDALLALKTHPWPGNIRQLENHIKKAMVLSDATHLSARDLELHDDAVPLISLAQAKEAFQRRYILDALARNDGNRTKTARELDVDPRTIFRALERMEGA